MNVNECQFFLGLRYPVKLVGKLVRQFNRSRGVSESTEVMGTEVFCLS